MEQIDLQLSVYVQGNCKPSQFLLNQLQGTEISNYVNVYVFGNEDFPPHIKKTPTVIYKNYPYTGKKAFMVIDELLTSVREELEQQQTASVEEVEEVVDKEEKVPEEKELDVVTAEVEKTLDGFSTLYDTGNHTMLTDDGFEENNIDFESLTNSSNESKKDYDINKLIEERRSQIIDLVPPKSN